MAVVIACPRCNAPLPPPHGGGFSTCSYCGATSSVGAHGAAGIPERAASEDGRRPYEERFKRSTETFTRVINTSGNPEEAAWYAAHDFEPSLVAPRDVWAGAVALAREFDASNQTTSLRDPNAMPRLFSAYEKLAHKLRQYGGSDTVNLPFFSVTKNGPVHLQRELDGPSLARLLATYAPR